MENSKNYQFLLKDLSFLKGVGKKTAELLKRREIKTIFDLLWRIPRSFTDRTQKSKIDKLQIGKETTINVVVKKYFS